MAKIKGEISTKFFSSLNNKGISDRNYKHEQKDWNPFKMKEIEDQVFLYNMLDVLTSLAVDTVFMKNMRAKFILNSLNFVTLASFSW